MVRHEFSYWLSAEARSAAELESADAWLHENGVVPEYLCESRTDGSENIRCYEVDPERGTIEEWDDAPEVIGRLAEAQPMLKLLLRFCDEEDHSIESLHYWHEGKHSVRYAKVISPDERSLILETEGGSQKRDKLSNRLAGGYVLVSTYASLSDAEAALLEDSDETPVAVIAVKEDFLASYVHEEFGSLEEFFGDYTYDSIMGLEADAELAGALAFSYSDRTKKRFAFPASAPSGAFLAYIDFLSGKLQEQGYQRASEFLDGLLHCDLP